MLSIAGPHEQLLVGRDAHNSVVSGLILSGVQPIWVEPQWDPDLKLAHPPAPEAYAAAFEQYPDVCVTSVHKMGAGLEQGSVFHQQGDLVDPAVLQARADLLGTTSPSVLIYAGLDGWRRHMVERGHELISAALDLAQRTRAQIEDIDGLHVYGEEFTGSGRAFDRDPLQIAIDTTGLGVR
jgi:arginine/lysine/ornithine decarboxylase